MTNMLEALQFSAQAMLAKRDFNFFCEFVHDRPLFAHQKMWARELQTDQDTLIIAPPGTLKSTLLTYFIEWSIGNNPDFKVLHIMNTATQASRQVMAIADTIEHNERYQAIFGIVPDKSRTWSKDTLYVQRTDKNNPYATVYGTGIDGPYQGVHVDMIVVDDPTDQQDVRSEITMQQQRERVRGVLRDRLNPGGKIIGILTRWGEADLVRDFEDMGFNVLACPVEGRYTWGRLLFPEFFSDEALQRIRSAKDQGGDGLSTGLYTLTYMCDPTGAAGSMVQRAWWQFYNDQPEFNRIIHSWDLSTGRLGGDFTSFGAWGVAENGYYLFDSLRDHLTMDGVIEKMRMLANRDRPQAILVEDAGTSIPVVDYLKKHTRLPIHAIKPGSRDKVSRLQGVVHLIEAKRVWLPVGKSWVAPYMDELAAFPGGQHDDAVDMTSQALTYLEKRGAFYGRSAEPVYMNRRW